ncbi:sensor histidine kinase [Streptomyces sp. N35]|uniref:sensor histidine kinase n=1 Tax=Streptomyces sp. N35 TaxID=2795730 RepID=UPI0027DBAFDD|nr:sensor histidine kinase [Streptomyces sp. N35]
MLKEQVSGGSADHDPDAGWLARIMHITFFALLGASLVRFLLRHPGEARTPWIIAFSVLLALLYVLGPALGARPTGRWMLWLGAVVGVWVVLVLLAPSFTWCAVPLFYTGLRTLPVRPALSLVVLLTGFVVVAQMRLADEFDPNLLVAPPAVAALAVAVFVHMRRQSERLAAIQRREGTLAERQRLAMEIHDTLAQGLSSQRMLLQAADRVWESDPDKARTHVRTAGSFADRNLAEARRSGPDLAPAELAGGAGLAAALTALAERSTTDTLAVRCRIEGPARALPDRVESALLRIAQGALANITEHSGASAAALTLTFLDDQVVLDIADNGRGFDPAGVTPTGVRGHGLPAIRARAGQLGGILTVESAPGEGTVLSAAIPLEHRP